MQYSFNLYNISDYMEYVITKPELCDKLVSFYLPCISNNNNSNISLQDANQQQQDNQSTNSHYYLCMGMPQCITGKQYKRNALMFNITFVFDINEGCKNEGWTIQAFKPVIRKFIFTLRTLEVYVHRV